MTDGEEGYTTEIGEHRISVSFSAAGSGRARCSCGELDFLGDAGNADRMASTHAESHRQLDAAAGDPGPTATAGPVTEGRMRTVEVAELDVPPPLLEQLVEHLGKPVTLHTVDGGAPSGVLESVSGEHSVARLTNGARTFYVPLHMVAVVEV